MLLHAVNRGSPQHAVAHRALSCAYVQGPVALAWPALLGFFRPSTRSGSSRAPLSVGDALQIVDAWLAHEAAVVVQPTGDHAAVPGRLLPAADPGWSSDAHLAALAIEHGATLMSFDRDFARFTRLRTELLA